MSSVYGIGVDVVDIARFQQTLQRQETMLARLFTSAESTLELDSLAGRFAAKEAFVKALRAPAGMSWQDVEVVSEHSGAPNFALHGAAQQRVNELGITRLHVSISHDSTVATAFVVAEC